MGLNKEDLFNLTVRDAGPNVTTERYLNVSYKNSPRRVDKVLEAESKLVRWDNASPLDPTNPPAIAADSDPVTKAEKTLADALKAVPQVPADITAAQIALNLAKKAMDDAVSNGGDLTKGDDFSPQNGEADKKGLYALEQADVSSTFSAFHPTYHTGDVDVSLISAAAAYCEKAPRHAARGCAQRLERQDRQPTTIQRREQR